MNKITKIAFYWMILLAISNPDYYSQENIFSILAKSGDISIRINNSPDWSIPFTGQKLHSGDLIKIGTIGYIGLVHTSLNTLELHNAGIYPVEQLEGKMNLEKTSLTKKFTAFIMDEMTVRKDKSKNMKSLGAVVRLSNMRIDVNLPQNTNFIDSVFTFSWYPNPESDKYIFQLLNPSGKTIYMSELTDTSLTLNLNNLNLIKDEKYRWLIFNSNQPGMSSDTTYFTVVSKTKKKNIQNELSILTADLENDEALANIVEAYFYRDKGLNLNAIEKYKKALNLEPGVEEYWESYLQFLINVGLKRLALNEWNRSTFAVK